jgi:tetratricopeptide (TPR) repeat protein
LEKSGQPEAAETFRRAALALSQASGTEIDRALGQSQLGINLLLQQRFADAAPCLERAHAALQAAAQQRPSAWAMHLTSLGLLALERDELEVAAARLNEALAAFRQVLHEVDVEDPLFAAELLLVVRDRWTADDVQSVGDLLLSVLQAEDPHDLSLGLDCLRGLTWANESLAQPDVLLRSALVRAAATCLARVGTQEAFRPTHAAAIACVMVDGSPAEALRTLADALGEAASRLEPGSTEQSRAQALQVRAAVAAGRLEQGRRVAAAALGAPLAEAADLVERWLDSGRRLLAALRQAGQTSTALQLRHRFEAWLTDAVASPADTGEVERLRAALALAVGRLEEGIELLRAGLNRIEAERGCDAERLMAPLADLLSALIESGRCRDEALETCDRGLRLAVMHEGDGSTEACWWRGMRVFALLDDDDPEAAVEAFRRYAEALPTSSAAGSVAAADMLHSIRRSLLARGHVRQARMLESAFGTA